MLAAAKVEGGERRRERQQRGEAVFSEPRAPAEVERPQDLDLTEVGREAQMPWEADGRLWHTQNRVGQAEAQLPDAVKREGVVVNRSSPDILMVVGLNSPKGTYDATFLGNYCDINLVDAIDHIN